MATATISPIPNTVIDGQFNIADGQKKMEMGNELIEMFLFSLQQCYKQKQKI